MLNVFAVGLALFTSIAFGPAPKAHNHSMKAVCCACCACCVNGCCDNGTCGGACCGCCKKH